MAKAKTARVHDRALDEPAALRAVVEGTASDTGQAFFDALVQNLARALGTLGAWITEYVEEEETLRALSFWLDDRWERDFEFTIPGSPCEDVVRDRRLIHIPDRLLELYPDEADAPQVGAVSYLGVPLLDPEGRLLGHLAVMDRRPLPPSERLLSLFEIFANRATAEMHRMQVQTALREREEKLSRLVEGAMDGIVELDEELGVTLVNEAAAKLFGGPAERMRAETFRRFLRPEGRRKLESLVAGLGLPGGEPFAWISGGGLDAVRYDGTAFPAEATLSRYEVRGHPFYTLILRNVDERLEAERKIQALSAETRYLREEIAAGSSGIIGESAPVRRALEAVARVAPTEATVMICGETGTGKELFARAIHERSRRQDGPLIKVNCAAIPGTLIESELFGHEKGAFTGATQRREGRFTLADGGTIFLDEVGELPLELQGKLLRVLQEGEYEPVGSSRTRKVDVRVVAATNRDLEEAVRRGEFRQDLYYRLDVFPLRLPPLRERGRDVVLIASALAATLAREMGRAPPEIGPDVAARLMGYPWPGNVRELRNVIERALITSPDGRLDLGSALPDPAGALPPEPADPAAPADGSPARVLTDAEMRELERANLVRALEATGWQVGGDGGAAELLDLPPSTVKSRIRSLGIERPAAG